MKKAGIYKIESPTGKVYIGQSIDLKNRAFKYSCLHCKMQTKLYASLSKHGWEAHSFMVVHELPNDVSQDVLNSFEELYMSQYRDCGFNLLNIREAGRHGKISEETKDKLRVSLKKYYENPENREKTRLATKKAMSNPKVFSKISESKKGKKLSEETKRKISESNSGKSRPYSWLNAIKAREKVIGRKQSQEEKDKRAAKLYKKIEVDGVVYDSIVFYSKKYDIDRTKIWRNLKSADYPNWKYINN